MVGLYALLFRVLSKIKALFSLFLSDGEKKEKEDYP
jgi:hypothetical protein